MNLRLLLDLIRYHYQQNSVEFDRATSDIADFFRRTGRSDVADYIFAQMSSQSVSPQSVALSSTVKNDAFEASMRSRGNCETLGEVFLEVTVKPDPIPLPQNLKNSVNGIRLAIETRRLLSKFLFVGAPGTGKTEIVKQLAFSLGRKLYSVNFNQLIDSRMGQTAKNIEDLFKKISNVSMPESCLFLFDEIDGIALTRTDNHDIREMGRATTAFIRGMDSLHSNIIIFATTNLGERIDTALRRRFDFTLNFDCYKHGDLVNSALYILFSYLSTSEKTDISMRIARKIFEVSHLDMPGILKNKIRTAVAFSDPFQAFSFLGSLYREFQGKNPDVIELAKQGFSLREIELIANTSKSQVSRIINRGRYEFDS